MADFFASWGKVREGVRYNATWWGGWYVDVAWLKKLEAIVPVSRVSRESLARRIGFELQP